MQEEEEGKGSKTEEGSQGEDSQGEASQEEASQEEASQEEASQGEASGEASQGEASQGEQDEGNQGEEAAATPTKVRFNDVLSTFSSWYPFFLIICSKKIPKNRK